MRPDWTTALNSGPESPLRIHLIGVAGSGMSGLALLLMGMGHRVSGCDRVTTAETERMQSVGLKFSSPQTAQAVEGCDLVIYSSAIRPGNEGYDAAVALGIPMLRRAEALAAIVNPNKGIVVAGTHGKTTTSALAAHVLRAGNLNPSHYVGAEIPILGSNAHWSTVTEWFVAEGDESDGTLVQYRPEHAIVLNIEPEHLDFYRNFEDIKTVFSRFVEQSRGAVIYCGEDPVAAEVAGAHPAGAISYGWSEEFDYCARNLTPSGAGTLFEVVRQGRSLGEARLNIPGRHNVLNALAVIALATELGIFFNDIRGALNTFCGARRRFETKFQDRDYTVVDDYGHHPTEIKATLQTAGSLNPKRLICLFQPHRFTRTQLLRDEFGEAFDGVDVLYVSDVYPASEPPIPGITGQTIVDAVKERGAVPEVVSWPDKDTLHLQIGNRLQPGDCVLTLGAGDIHEAGARLARDLAFLEELRHVMADPGAVTRLYEPMRKHTTLKVGGPAQFWIEPATVEGMARLVKFCNERGRPLTVIGRGSNLLVRDGGIRGAIVCPAGGEFEEVVVEGDSIRAGVGTRLKRLTAAAHKAGLAGFEWMEGIPGNVGGGLRMNAGAMGAETFEKVVSVRYIDPDGNVCEKPADEFDVRYRNVPELKTHYAVSALFRGTPDDPGAIAARIEASKDKRKNSQPVAASAGCIFKNAETISAGMLVDQLGLKDSSEGAARVSEIHGNFIVNDGGATAAEVLRLVERIKATARRERGIELETEVQIIGTDDPLL